MMLTTKKQFIQYFKENFDLSNEITIISDKIQLTIDKNSISKMFCNDQYFNAFKYAGIGSGLFNLKVTYNDSSNIDNSYEVNLFDKSFQDLFNDTLKTRIFVPDTNFLMNRLFSGLSYTLGINYLEKHPVYIPRLNIMELEKIANLQGGKNERKRQVMATMSEVDYLKMRGAKYLSYLDQTLFEGFTKYSGEHMIDSWIRREIHQFKQKEIFGKQSYRSKIVFLSSDLINSLTAIAEELDTLYFSPLYEMTKNPTSEQIALMIILLSIKNESIQIKQKKSINCIGLWEGKTPLEWLTDSIRIQELTI